MPLTLNLQREEMSGIWLPYAPSEVLVDFAHFDVEEKHMVGHMVLLEDDTRIIAGCGALPEALVDTFLEQVGMLSVLHHIKRSLRQVALRRGQKTSESFRPAIAPDILHCKVAYAPSVSGAIWINAEATNKKGEAVAKMRCAISVANISLMNSIVADHRGISLNQRGRRSA